MKSLVKNIFATIIALTLLIGSTRFQVYQHSCAVHNYSVVSLFETPDCGKDHQVIEEVDDCCKIEEVEEASCCDNEDNSEIDYPIIKSKDNSCCVTLIQESNTVDNLFLTLEKKINSSTDDLFFTELI